MPQSPNKALLSCATLLATYSSAGLGYVKAEVNVAPEGPSDDHASDVNTPQRVDVTEVASAAVAVHGQSIMPDTLDTQPSFLAQTLELGTSAAATTPDGDLPQLEPPVLNSVSPDSTAEGLPLVQANAPAEEPPLEVVPTQTLRQRLSSGLEDRDVSASLAALAGKAPQSVVSVDEANSLGNVEGVDIDVIAAEEAEPSGPLEVAQFPTEPPILNPRPQDQQEIEELLDFSSQDDSTPYRSSPAITISNPSGFGADNATGFIGVGYQERTRFANQDDGGLVVGVGLGDARENVGVQLSYTAASFGGSREFGTGGFNLKLHKRLADDWSVALGWEGIVTTGFVDFEDSIYGSVSHLVRTRESIQQPFSRVALTAGVGSGRFRTEDDVFDDRDTVGVFGSVAVRVAEPVSAIVEWTGQDLAAGLSVVPFKNVPIVLLPAVRDITGAGDGARFVMGAGVSFEL